MVAFPSESVGNAKAIYKLVKANQVPPALLEKAHEAAFPGEEFDPENPVHCQLFQAVVASKADIEAAQIKSNRNAARLHLQSQGVTDFTLIPDSVLDEVYASLETQREAEETGAITDGPIQVVVRDDEDLVLTTASGEIIGFIDAPRMDAERREILEWVGEALTRAQAKEKGRIAEKQAWIDKINKAYDPIINKQARYQKRLVDLYTAVAQAYLDEMIEADKKARGEEAFAKRPLRSVKIGLLTCGYTKTSAKTDVLDETKAVIFCEENFPEAVKKSILVSQIPDTEKPKLDPEISGIKYSKGGDDKFALK